MSVITSLIILLFLHWQDSVTVRKMAAKKGAQIQFQTEVGNDEEWNKLLEKTGLIGNICFVSKI